MEDKSKLFQIAGEEAENRETFSSRAAFGKLSISSARFIKWEDSNPTDVTEDEFVTLPARQRSLELKFTVDIQEFRDVDYTYERKVRIGDSDWWATVRPSIEAVKGKKSMSKGKYAETLEQLDGTYVEVHDVPQVKSPDYSAIKFAKVFSSRDECFEAWKERYGEDGSGMDKATEGVPAGWDASVWAEYVPQIKEALTKGTLAVELATMYGVTVADIESARGA